LICTSLTLPASQPGAVDFMEIHTQAGFANAAYESEDKIRAFVESKNYTLTLYKTDQKTQVSYFLATSELEKTQVIAVRGTANIDNAAVNIWFKLRLDKISGISLHEGFSSAARKAYADLKPLLKPGYKIRTTGHSLGGAIALVLAMYLDLEQFDIDQVTTFGQPKITNMAGAIRLDHINIIRVVTPVDLVPIIPLLDPLDINNVELYWHAGKEVILLSEDQYAILEGIDSMLRATRFTQRTLTQENLHNHQMSVYLGLLDAKTKSSRLVPYKTDLNLFNLFGS